MSANNNIYNILGKLDALEPKEPTVKETAKKIYESVEAQGSILSGVKKFEANLSEKFQGFKKMEGNKYAYNVLKAKEAGKKVADLDGDGDMEKVKEQDMTEKAPPGMEDMVMKLKKQYPDNVGRAYATAWDIYNKKQGKKEESVEENVEEGSDYGQAQQIYDELADIRAVAKQAQGGGQFPQGFASRLESSIWAAMTLIKNQSLEEAEIIKTKSGIINKGSYGTEYQGDPDEEPSVDAPKKRGRPAKGTAPKPKNAPGVRGRPVKAPAPSFNAPKGDIFGRTTGAVPKGTKGATYKMIGEAYDHTQFAKDFNNNPYEDSDFRPHADTPSKDRWNGGKESKPAKYQYPKTPHGHDMEHEQFGSNKIGYKSYRDIHDPIPAKPLSSVAKVQYDPAVLESILESVNFSEMMRETHQTLDEILSELQSDINTFRETGTCSDKLRDFMDVHRHSKRQMADEAQPASMAQPSVQPGQVVYYRGKAGKVDRCEGNKCFVYTSGGNMDVWPTEEVSDTKQSMLDVLKKDAGDIGKGLKGFMTGKDEVNELSQLAGLGESKTKNTVEECMDDGAGAMDNMNISTNMSSDGNKSVTISASGEQAEMLMQLLQLAGVGGQATTQAQPAVAMVNQEEEVEEADTASYRNTPDEKVATTQQVIDQGNDLNRKKAQDELTANPAANPFVGSGPKPRPPALEENEAVANLGAHLMSQYESIKVQK
jgi:hypothetical protein